VYLLVFIQNPLMDFAEKILLIQPLSFGELPANGHTISYSMMR
jgi:hypothetical protein